MKDVVAVILGGGRGAGLFPLTLERAEPAVPIAGKYRLIDVPISNCLNSALRRIFVLTQFNSESLNQYVTQTYKFDVFTSGFVSILAAEQTESDPGWFQGTANAVRQSLWHLASHRMRDVLILSGDQLYQMDFRQLLETHRRTGADATVATIPVSPEHSSQFGILSVDGTGRVVNFDEKPPRERLGGLECDIPGYGRGLLASMGIYLFRQDALEHSLADPTLIDFGRHLIPQSVPNMHVQAHVFRGYWDDLGNLESYYRANLALCDPVPPLDFYDAVKPIYTNPRFLPATKIDTCHCRNSLISDGCILLGPDIDHCVIGIRSRIGFDTKIKDSLVLGADYYQTLHEIDADRSQGVPPVGIGAGTIIERAIIDKNARIGCGVRILNEAKVEEKDGNGYYIRHGIVVVPKGATIPDGTVI